MATLANSLGDMDVRGEGEAELSAVKDVGSAFRYVFPGGFGFLCYKSSPYVRLGIASDDIKYFSPKYWDMA